MLDLVEITRRNLQHLGERGLTEPAFAPELTKAPSNVRFGHVASVRALRTAPSQSWQGWDPSRGIDVRFVRGGPEVTGRSSSFAFWGHRGWGDGRTCLATLLLAMTGVTRTG
ncbi:Uncharacterised protein [Mycobacteroides abscessus subsp. abscessus]|nr:Uncharacterised protein [Mycobacteroides abscessus subsp. abscessus]